jgi:hypothetical protein
METESTVSVTVRPLRLNVKAIAQKQGFAPFFSLGIHEIR